MSRCPLPDCDRDIPCRPPAPTCPHAFNGEQCLNEQWVAENPGHTIEWARAMWWCDCPKCKGAANA